MPKKVLKIALGIASIPFCAGFTWQLGTSVFSIAYKPLLAYYFIGGGLAYLTIHFVFKQPILTYVVAHELTHALFALLFGGSVKAFHATERGGQVTITKSNFLITLAPYFFPLYTFLALILHRVVSAAGHPGPAAVLIFLSGASFAFHLVLTIIFLGADQKDIREEGAVFSFPLIYLFNVIFCALLVHLLLAQKNGFLDYLGNAIIESIRIWTLVFTTVSKLFF
jgi:hypothetical protein